MARQYIKLENDVLPIHQVHFWMILHNANILE
jgi:hypothetical protein